MQKLAEVCIRRPVFAAMLILALGVVGAASYFRLGVDRFPAVDLPTVTVPAEALVTFAGIEKVLVVEGGRAVEKRVTTGRRSGDRLEILSGLAAGEQVILRPGALASGQPVTAGP